MQLHTLAVHPNFSSQMNIKVEQQKSIHVNRPLVTSSDWPRWSERLEFPE